MKHEDLAEYFIWDDTPTEIQFKTGNECAHNWEKYIGLREVYYYCGKCNKKDSKDNSNF